MTDKEIDNNIYIQEDQLEDIVNALNRNDLFINGELDVGIKEHGKNYLLGLNQSIEELRDELKTRNEIEAQRNELIKLYITLKFNDDTITDIYDRIINRVY